MTLLTNLTVGLGDEHTSSLEFCSVSLFILLKQTCLKDTMKVLWKSDWIHVNCALEHQWCKCACFYFENFNCAALSRLLWKLTFVLFRAVPWRRVASSTCGFPLREQCWGRASCWGTGLLGTKLPQKSSHTGGWKKQFVATQISLHGGENLCLSTVFYSVSSDDKCNGIKPVKCMGPG